MPKTAATPETTPPPAVPAGAPLLRAAGLRKTFRMGDSDVQVLKEATLTVRAGEFVAIEGRSGSGKSTLLHILGALDDPDGGSVEYLGGDREPGRVPAGAAGRALRGAAVLLIAAVAVGVVGAVAVRLWAPRGFGWALGAWALVAVAVLLLAGAVGRAASPHLAAAADHASAALARQKQLNPRQRWRSVVRALSGKWAVGTVMFVGGGAAGLFVQSVVYAPQGYEVEKYRARKLEPAERVAVEEALAKSARMLDLFGNVVWVVAALAVPLALAGAVRMTVAWLDDRIAARARNHEFGFVFQFYHLLPELTVLENTMLGQMVRHGPMEFVGARSALRERAKQVLTQLGMDHRLTHRPAQLSGGERQRVAIARALMNEPRILFADEPTGNLDADTGRQIMDVIEGLHRDRGQTIVMVTHDRALAREADRVLVLKDGRLEKAEG